MQAQCTSRLGGIVTSLPSGVMVVTLSLGMLLALQATRPGAPLAAGGTFMLAATSASDG